MIESVLGYKLDDKQIELIKDNSNSLLVIAGAGSGKTLSIVGKVKYLINSGINPNEILCVTFTNAAANSLCNKIKEEMHCKIDTFTFHKLAISILKNNYEIADTNLLDDITYNFLYNDVLNNKLLMKCILIYNHESYNNIIKSYNIFLNSKKIKIFMNKLITFIRLFKCGGYELNDFISFSNKIKTINFFKYRMDKIFITIVLNIYLKYQDYLKNNNELDFDDLIIEASKYVNSNGYKDIKYIIIDEYQDTSMIRFNLIKSIINKTNAKIMAVGDDYQSIYRFTGCDLSLFLNFSNYFKDTRIIKLNNTYRNSQELIDIASSFIMKNKKQIKKNMISNKYLKKPIKIIKEKDLFNTIDKLNNKGSLLILARNNDDFKNYNLKDNCMTIHKSKGLEADNVIIINLSNDILGFPSQIKDDNIFRLVTNNNDNYPYSEERRLFYVALTRTKNYVYLVESSNPSIFLKEIKRKI